MLQVDRATFNVNHEEKKAFKKGHDKQAVHVTKKTKMLVFSGNEVQLRDGVFYNVMRNPPVPLEIVVLESRHFLDFSCNMPPNVLKASRLTESSSQQLQMLNSYKAASTGDRQADVMRHGGEREADAANTHAQHCFQKSHVGALHALRHFIRPEDMSLVTCLLKSFQADWVALVASKLTSFECGVCGKVVDFMDEDGSASKYTFDVRIERSSIVKVVERLLARGERVDGVEVMKLLCSTQSKNVVISCCRNTQRALDLDAVEAMIIDRVVMGVAKDEQQ